MKTHHTFIVSNSRQGCS